MRRRAAWMSGVLAVALGAGAGAAEAQTPKARVLFLIAPGVNGHEFTVPFEVGRAVGYEFDLAGPAITNLLSGKGGAPVARINVLLDDVKDLSPYAGVVVPGGGSPANLAQYPRALEICRQIAEAKLPVLAMCHGPRLLIKAGVMKDRVFTCLPRVADELADEWKTRDCGKFVDRGIVLDGNLLTSPHFHYGESYCRAMIELFEKNGGIPVALKPARVLVATAGASFQPHEKWALTAVPRIPGTRVEVLDKPAALKPWAETNETAFAGMAALYVLPGKDLDATLQEGSFGKVAAKARSAGAPVIGVNAAAGKMRAAGIECEEEKTDGETYDAYVRLIVKRTQQSGRKTPAAEEAAKPATASIRLMEGFDAGQYAALRAFLDWSGETAEVLGPKAGWMRGKDGCPALVDRAAGGESGAKCVFTVSAEGVKTETRNVSQAAAVPFAHGAAGASDEGPFTAAMALREGFDDAVYAAMRAALAWTGRKTVILGPAKGELRGLNGVAAQAAAAYDQAPDVAADAIVILPGGLYPDKVAQAQQAVQPAWVDEQDKRDAARVKWVMDAYGKGATLVVFGYDGARVGGLDSCKGLKFAAPVHAGSKFGQKGAQLASSEAAMKTKERIYSAQTDESLGALLRLLEQDGIIAMSAGGKGK